MVYYVAPGIIFTVLKPPYIIYRNPTCKELSNNIAAREHSRAGCSCCCCFSHSAHWLPTRKKLLYTVANPARGLLNREKKKKKKSGSAPPPPPPRAARSEKKNKNKIK